MLQESTADGFESTASYCGIIACISSSYIFVCTVVLGCCVVVFLVGERRVEKRESQKKI